MSALDTGHYRDLLLDRRKQVTDALEGLQAGDLALEEESVDTPSDHLADAASITYDRELEFTLEENSEHVVEAIDAALRRILEGSYGLCQNCGEPISPERLEALPYAELCIDCKRKQER